MHIGSQITDLEPFRNAFRLMRELAQELRADGHKLEHLDIGGGLGVPYMSDDEVPPLAVGLRRSRASEQLGDLGLKIVLEPGRMIVGNAGVLVTRVIYAKRGRDKTFTIVDAAMNDLIRPTLYEAHHEIWPVQEAKPAMPPIVQDVVGPVCETGDYLALDRKLPPLRRRRPHRLHDGGRLRRGDVLDLQYAPAGAGGAGERRRLRRRAPAHRPRRPHRPRPRAGVADLKGAF